MNLNEYQEKAMKFAKYKYVDYPFLALAEECGELHGKLAKHCRKNDKTLTATVEYANRSITGDLKLDLIKELGDVLWQLQACCSEVGVTLEHVAIHNLNKLDDRDNRGVIIGEGDER